jgi:YgiT-type zinc finger domain-containing protein
MTCALCGETAEPAKVTVTLERDSTTVVFRGVPAEVCPQCGEQWVADDVAAKLLAIVELQAEAGVQVEVREYSVAA